MKTENDAEYRERIKTSGLSDTVHGMVRDLIRSGKTQPAAWMSVRDAFTPDGVEMAGPKGKGFVERPSQEESKKLKKELEDASNATCTLPVAVQWTMDNLETKKANLPKEPGRSAMSLWNWAHKTDSTKAEFIRLLVAKMLPSQKDLDNQARYKDDGSTQIELAERILARMADNAS